MQEYGAEAYTMIVDMFEDSAIVRFYSYIDGSCKLMRVQYTCTTEGVVTLGNVNEVHVTYEDVVTASSTATVTEETGVEQATPSVNAENTEEPTVNGETPVENAEINIVESTAEVVESTAEVTESSSEVVESTAEIVNAEEQKPAVEENKEVVAAACDSDAASAAQVSNAEVTEVTENVTKVSVEDEEPKQEENSSSTSFTESERAEFEALKREEKVGLINSYKDNLSEDAYNNFMSSVDEKSKDELEFALLKAYKEFAEEELKKPKAERAFSFAPILNIKEKQQDSLDAWVKNNLD